MNRHAGLLRFLMAMYLPFLGLVCAVAVLLLIVIVLAVANRSLFAGFLVLAALLVLMLGQVLWAARVLFQKLPDDAGSFEIRLPEQFLAGVRKLVNAVGEKRSLPTPDEIRLAADDVACVYENGKGDQVLVLGGAALASLSQQALAGVIAHELGHFAAGDTGLSRRGFRQSRLIASLEYSFQTQFGARWNPLVWVLRLYHLLYALVWAANSREQEYAADRQSVSVIGKEATGAALIYITLADKLPWLRLSSIAETSVATRQPVGQIFAEQRERAKHVGKLDWEEACEKELAEPTGWFDTHPCLRERLKGIRVAPRKALNLAMEQHAGKPACELIPLWPKIEKEMTERIVQIFRKVHQEKMEVGQILRGGPV
jgi:Zn-dependent protease with chaperone function